MELFWGYQFNVIRNWHKRQTQMNSVIKKQNGQQSERQFLKVYLLYKPQTTKSWFHNKQARPWEHLNPDAILDQPFVCREKAIESAKYLEKGYLLLEVFLPETAIFSESAQLRFAKEYIKEVKVVGWYQLESKIYSFHENPDFEQTFALAPPVQEAY